MEKKDGYLTVSAVKDLDEDEKDKETGKIGYCLVVAAVLSIIWFIWRAWRYANKKGNVCDEVISITAFVHFALAGTYFVAEMAFPDGNYFWGNNLPFFTGTLENNLLYLAELGIVYRILRKSIGK